MQRRPILANSCARAASAAEARYRIETPINDQRSTAVFALDAPARAIVGASRSGHSDRVRFMAFVDGEKKLSTTDGNGSTTDGSRQAPPSDGDGTLAGRPMAYAVPIANLDTPPRPVASALDDADLVLMVATSPIAGPAAATVGNLCAERQIMTAGLVVGSHDGADDAAAAIRPYARMLLVTEDVGDLDEILRALRA